MTAHLIPSAPICENCIFWNRVSEETGECRAEPPKAFIFPVMAPPAQKVMLDQVTAQPALQMIGQTVFPTTTRDGWCGFHPEREIEDEGTGPDANASKFAY
jgi:hypothetical protein